MKRGKVVGREKQARRDNDEKSEGERETECVVCGGGGERFYRSYYFEETAVIYTPSEQLMSVIHQQDAYMRHCRGNIMLTG